MLSSIYVLLREDILQDLVINEELKRYSIQIVSSYMQSKHDYYQLQVLFQIVLLMKF